MLHIIGVILVGLVIGALAGAVTSRGLPISGWIGNLVAGLAGSWLGQAMFGEWGPSLSGIAILPSILGAIILVVIVSIIMGVSNKSKRQ